ncbi:MAG: class I SAM-dependent methyltransferase [Candidatus Omnitrophica bacterium]|nr:class I SAM-dependent methyltransferase [Candidatus Omnitrophota bacterium]
MDKEVLSNHKRYLERVNFYRSNGYDLEKERDFILDKSLPVSGEILEIGTGKGHFALALAKRGYSFISIDVSRQEQEIAMLNLRYLGLENRVNFRIGDAARLDFPDGSFDAIFLINVLHHLESPLLVLDEIIRLLRPGGKAVLSDFTNKGLEIINACHTHEGRRHDHFRYCLSQAKDYFVAKGFYVDEYQSRVQEIIIAERIQG